MSRCLTAAFFLLVLGAPGAHAAGDRIWSALVLATKEDPSTPIPEPLKEFAPAH